MEPVSVVDSQSETGTVPAATGGESLTEAGTVSAGDTLQIGTEPAIAEDASRIGSVSASDLVGDIAPPAFTPAPVLAPGEILKKAREARGESLSNVAQALKLSAQQLRALESGKLDALPGLTFARGFLRNYARYLNVDPEPLLASLDARTPDAVDDLTRVPKAGKADKGPEVKPSFRLRAFFMAQTFFAQRTRKPQQTRSLSQTLGTPRTSRSMPSILLTVLVLAAVASAVFFLGGVKFQYEPAAPGVERPTKRIENVLPTPNLVSITAPPPAPPRQSVEVVSLDGQTTNTLTFQNPDSKTVPSAGTDTASAPIPNDLFVNSAAPESDVATLRFSFSIDALVQVRGKNGKIIFSRVGSRGRTYNVQVKDNLPVSLMIKQAGKVKLDFNGIPIDLKPHTNREGVARLSLQ
ncbi:MAG: DUF4115 domain-containing protein [Azoarcus sp.]|jgi:cytoskeleton protein RodZ|nr:DUF4115 domain-containing protein [Azoarcus sp.]